MDSFLDTLYQQYAALLRQQALTTHNLQRVGELILHNGGTIPTTRSTEERVEQPPAKTTQAATKATGYNPHTNWQDKIIYILKEAGEQCTAKQIALRIRQLEPDTTLSVEKSVELTTSRMSKAGLIRARKEGVKNYYFV